VLVQGATWQFALHPKLIGEAKVGSTRKQPGKAVFACIVRPGRGRRAQTTRLAEGFC